MAEPQPRAYGYMQIRATTGLAASHRAGRDIASAARQEGYALADIFVERDSNRPGTRLAALVSAARRSGIRTVILSDWNDLGNNPTAATDLRLRLQREAELTVVCAADALHRTDP